MAPSVEATQRDKITDRRKCRAVGGCPQLEQHDRRISFKRMRAYQRTRHRSETSRDIKLASSLARKPERRNQTPITCSVQSNASAHNSSPNIESCHCCNHCCIDDSSESCRCRKKKTHIHQHRSNHADKLGVAALACQAAARAPWVLSTKRMRGIRCAEHAREHWNSLHCK